MMGVPTLSPSSVTLVSMSTMSRSMRGRSFSARHAAMLSFAVISSSAPVSQNTHDSGRITRVRLALQRIQIDAIHQHFLALISPGITPDH